MSVIEALILPDNLYWAWIKVRNFYRQVDGWHDELEVADFELHLDRELKTISRSFERLRYKTDPLRPLPQPKRKNGDGNYQTRQFFWVSVRDQVAWTAYINVVGPIVDARMPPWSYGNRLYRTVWFDESGNKPQLQIGKYRNSSGQIYRPFRQSWPVYRRHIHLTVKRMAAKGRGLSGLEIPEKRVYEVENDLEPAQQLPYLQPDFWNEPTATPCWAGLDLEVRQKNSWVDSGSGNLPSE